MNTINVTLYMRENCTLCKEAYYLLVYLSDQYPLNIIQVDITQDAELERKYLLEIPVIEVEGEIVATCLVEEHVLRDKFEQVRNV